MMPYIIILKVRKFHQSTINRFGTEMKKPVGVAPLPLPPPNVPLSLNRGNFGTLRAIRTFVIFRQFFIKIVFEKHPHINQLPWKPNNTCIINFNIILPFNDSPNGLLKLRLVESAVLEIIGRLAQSVPS